jgi:hypothetical protein
VTRISGQRPPLAKAALLNGLGQGKSARCLTTRGPHARRRELRLHDHQAEAQPLVGGARPRRRVGVPHGVPEGRA